MDPTHDVVSGDVIFRTGQIATVELVAHTVTPGEAIAKLARGYDQVYTNRITPAEVERYTEELKKTRLQTPCDAVQFTFLISQVTRVFTHQLVRYRIGTSFVQESMRFYTNQAVPIRIPDAIANHPGAGELIAFCEGCTQAVGRYQALLEAGLSREDARGILPHNTLTSIFATLSLRTLAHIYMQRSCCQAQQEEWSVVLREMKMRVQESCPDVAHWLMTPWEAGRSACGFNASFDRPCKWPERFGK